MTASATVRRAKPKTKPAKKPPKPKGKPIHWIMRYYSNRGTDCRICVSMPAGTKPKDALERAKSWAAERTANSACYEYTVTVRQIRLPPKTEMRSRWSKICDRKEKIMNEYNDARAMLSPIDWTGI